MYFIKVCSSSGNIVAIASVLVQAAANKMNANLNKPIRSPLHSVTRKQYKVTSTFVFNMDTKEYYIVDKESLQEEDSLR